ncbi:hypothetical protein GCM10010387_66450 [Streptomyces inusitatus]|uniref:Uncharacterized protein n=1 Tax=Streptomyces inusitatus TaxID=68221 RepID=A0A918QSE6_9ACTN|nr:hypothetical protein GCM10010387_66450 [Streptomyces inusitatus]
MGIGMLVAGVAAPLAVYIGVDEYQERADRRAVESAARAVIQQRVDLNTAVGRDSLAPRPRQATEEAARALRASYAKRAQEGRKAATEGRGLRSSETRLFDVEVEFFADDFASIDFSQETDFAREVTAAGESEEGHPPTVSSHSFSFRKVDGEWLLSQDRGPDEFA